MADNALAVRQAQVALPDTEVLTKWGKLAIEAKMLPPDTNIAQAAVIIQAGHEMGMQPLQALRSMNFIKGRLTMSVQLQLALAKQNGIKCNIGESTNDKCIVTLSDRDGNSVTTEYAIEDARRAGLVQGGGNWAKYPKQMLRWRAIGDGLRLLCPDIILGMISEDEAEHLEPVGADIFGQPAQEQIVSDGFNDELLEQEIEGRFKLLGCSDAEIEALEDEYSDRAELLREINDRLSKSIIDVEPEPTPEPETKPEPVDPLDAQIEQGFDILRYTVNRRAELREKYPDKRKLLSMINQTVDGQAVADEARKKRAAKATEKQDDIPVGDEPPADGGNLFSANW